MDNFFFFYKKQKELFVIEVIEINKNKSHQIKHCINKFK